MKKIIYILFLFIIILTCYITYYSTQRKDYYCAIIGDIKINKRILQENNIIKTDNNIKYNYEYVNQNYTTTELLDIMKYNIKENNQNIHQVIKKSDTIIISIGNNDLKIFQSNPKKNIYKSINKMISDIENIIKIIKQYNKEEIYIIKYINNKYNNHDIYVYTNYKLNKLCKKYGIKIIDSK